MTPVPAGIEPLSDNPDSVNGTTTPDSGSMPSSGVVPETRTVRRRSARLAKKVGVNGSMPPVVSVETNPSDLVDNEGEGMVGSGDVNQTSKSGVERISLNKGFGGIDLSRKRKMLADDDVDFTLRLSGYKIVESMDRDWINDGGSERTLSRADKGKEKLVYDDSVMYGSDKGKEKLVYDDSVMNGSDKGKEKLVYNDEVLDDTIDDFDSNSDSETEAAAAKLLLNLSDLKSMGVEDLVRRRLNNEQEKGKGKVGDMGSSSNHNNEPNADANGAVLNQPGASTAPLGNIGMQFDIAAHDAFMANYRERRRAEQREHSKEIAKALASSFANFSSKDELQLGHRVRDLPAVEVPAPKPDNWCGQFATALKTIKDREPFARWIYSNDAGIKWTPSNQEQGKRLDRPVPSLQDLCLSVLSENADSITSLDFVPDMLRHKICWALCDSRKINSHFLELLLQGSPTEIRIRDCSWLSEEPFMKAFERCQTDELTMLQFDLAGQCLPDYTLSSTLARSPNSLPALTTLSLKGAYRLTDEGLRMLVASAPNLKSVNLSECSMLTYEGVCCLVDSLRKGLRELYLDACLGVDANLILLDMLKLESLEVLSLAGIQTVSDDFVCKIVSVHGCRMKEIILADCMKLTDSSLEAIGNNCSGLNALDLRNLSKVTDVGICPLANGCQEIQMLKFSRNELSDEVVAAYLDIRGSSLTELSLNKIKVSNNTAQSIAKNCKNLQTLDLSWCRNLTDEDMGLIVDNCSSLELVKLFGCTQVTSVFLNGYSNPRVKFVGLKLSSVVQHIDVPDFLQGPLRYSFPV